MRIVGVKDKYFGTNYYYITATFISSSPHILHPTTFLVDTGCQITTIGARDFLSFKIPFPPITGSASGIGGNTPTSSLFRCGVAFDLVQSIHVEKLDRIDILNPQKIANIMRVPSLLGLDILGRYSVHFDSNFVYLDK